MGPKTPKQHSRDTPWRNRVDEVVKCYDAQASELVSEYENFSFEQLHEPVMDLIESLPSSDACILDIGSGSGRDAAWFAARKHKVVAVEPSHEMSKLAQERHHTSNIRWIDDKLPELKKVLSSKITFDLIWLSAVWMHVPRSERERAFRKLMLLLRPGGSVMITLRHGPSRPGFRMEPVTSAEIESYARQRGLETVRVEKCADSQGRAGISWEVIWLRLPDDGTGALPLLRHIVLHDRKSSTYKLALLRTIIRIANEAGGFAKISDDGSCVDLPFGLVALFWIRAFQPLIKQNISQLPRGNKSLAFAKAGFDGLRERSPYDLRVGQQFIGKDATNLIDALKDATQCIKNMPAKHITYPGKHNLALEKIFLCERKHVPPKDMVQIDEPFLWSFGTFTVPIHLWQTMSRYSVWIEPAVLSEWVEVMRGYSHGDVSRDAYMEALRWLDPEHDTTLVRKIGQQLRDSGTGLFCVWSGRRIRRKFDIDHCFPFSAWPCNDLWNLLPSLPAQNRNKSNRLPALEVLDCAKEYIFYWWDKAYFDNPQLKKRFSDEGTGAFPGVNLDSGVLTRENVFEGMMQQQIALHQDQQIQEWYPKLME